MGNKHRISGGRYGKLSGRKLDAAIDRQLAREKDAADRAARRFEQQGSSSAGYQYGGSVNGQDAKTRDQDGRMDALYGGQSKADGTGHSHLVAKDGVNAHFLREGGEIIVNGGHPTDAYSGSPEVDPTLE